MDKQQFLDEFYKLVKDYQAAPDVLKKISQLTLLIIIGPSGVGKTKLIQELDLPYVASDVTRSPRQGEQNGMDYYFRTDYEQILEEIRNGRFVQVAISPDGECYSTRENSYPDYGSATMAVVADVVPIFRDLGFGQTISAFITPPSYEEWMRRLGNQHLSEDKIQKRLAEARRSFSFALSDDQTHFTLNDELRLAKVQIEKLLNGTVDHARETQAREIAQQLLYRLPELSE